MKVLVAAGASGGHIFPALAFIKAFRKKYSDSQVLLILPERAKNFNLEISGFDIEYIDFPSLKRSLTIDSLRRLTRIFLGSCISIGRLLKFKPDLVIGFGSLISVPLVLAGWFLRAKTLIHEQNVIPGRANKLLSYFVDKIALSFSEGKSCFNNCISRVVFTGNPLRQELQMIDRDQARQYFGFKEDKFTVLVAGGSQGSEKINHEFSVAASNMQNSGSLSVIHLCGKGNSAVLSRKYQQAGVECAVFDFFNAMQYAYSAADLIICRSGATTITELIRFNLPALLIPYPYSYQHQLANAKLFADKGVAVVIEDKDLSAAVLKEKILDFIKDPGLLKNMRKNYSNFLFPDNGEKISEEAALLIS